MQESTLKKYILMQFMTYGTIITEVFCMVHKNRSYVSKLVSKLEREKLIKEKKIVYKGTDKQLRYKVITVKGVEYVKEHYSDDYPWLNSLPSPIPKFTMTTMTNYDMLIRHLKSISAAIIFSQFNTYVSNERRVKYYRGKSVNFFDMVKCAEQSYKSYWNLPDRDNNNQNLYFHAMDIAPYFKLKRDDVAQNRFQQHIGLFIAKETSFFIYEAKPKGTKLNIEGLSRAQISGERFFEKYPNDETQYSQLTRVIVFTYSKKEFVDNYNSLSKCKTKAKGWNMNNLKMLCLLPVRYETIRIIKRLIYNHNINSYLSEHNSKVTQEIGFEIKYGGKTVGNGVTFDVIQIKKLCEIAIKNPTEEHILLCLDWQKEYYDALTLPDNIQIETVVI